jgi:outer membrane protein assembly factor BamA
MMPLLQIGYNIDDGIFIGGGVNSKRYNFRDSTFHKITGNLAIRTAAFAISYSGLYTSISQKFDMLVDADISFPRNVDNFFGLGNDTEKLTNDKQFYRVRYRYAWVNPRLKQSFGKKFSYAFGAFYQFFHVTDTTDKFIGEIYPELMDSSAYIPHHYTGLNLKAQLDTRDNILLPQRGVLWDTDVTGFYSIRENGRNFVKIRSDLKFYLSFTKDPRVTFAFRFGGAVNIGDYEFFHANFLGLQTNLRGFRSKRFAGDHSFYQNTEIRFKLLNIRSHVFNGQTGFFLFNDIGRVWVSDEDSGKWHDGFGIGAWLTPFDFTALTLTYSRSKEDRLLTFAFSFLF